MSSPSQTRTENAVAVELTKLAHIEGNLDAAVNDGRISAHDGEERKERAEHTCAKRIAFIRGDKRPAQRIRKPLDNPAAGRIG